ncbi:Fc.00g044260.m01.CDS01 [Cosmosporella sp. VM-42]
MAPPNTSSDASSSRRPSSVRSTTDPVLRNALRYTISAREYASLHKYVLSRSRVLRRTTPSPSNVDKALQPEKGKDDYNARAVRHALRVFVTTWLGMKGWDAVAKRMGDKDANTTAKKQPFYKSPALRLSLSLSTILLLYRLLFRFLTRLRAHLLDPGVEHFRSRNPRTAATLTSPYAPAVGASLAGLALGIYPSQKMRVGIAIYAIFRALEFGYNVCESDGLIWGMNNGRKRERPWWFGSWMLQPFAFGQLFHALVFDRDCFPKPFGDFIFKSTSAYLHPRPIDWPANMKWPNPYQIVDSLAEMARLNWPAYISPTLFPNKEQVLPATLTALGPLTSQAHPLITSLSCATLHPSDPSCSRTYLTFWLQSFGPLARFFFLIYSAMTVLPRLSTIYHSPLATLQRVLTASLRMTTFATGAISTAWASICFFQTWLPRHVLATQRFFLGGFFAGLWAWVERRHGRGVFLYTARASVDSLWKVGVKRRWWKSMKGGDVWVFVMALMITGVVYERDAQAIREANWRKGVSFIRGEGWRDWSVEDDTEEGEEKDKEERGL